MLYFIYCHVSSCNTLNPEGIKKFHKARLSSQKVKALALSEGIWGRMASPLPLLHSQSILGLSMRFLIPIVAFPVLVSSDKTTIWKSVAVRTKQLSLSSWRKIQCCVQKASKLELPTKDGQGTWLLEKCHSVGLDCINLRSQFHILLVYLLCLHMKHHGEMWLDVTPCLHTDLLPGVDWWQEGISSVRRDSSFRTVLLPVSLLGRGQPVAGFSSNPILPKSNRRLKPLLELSSESPTLPPPAATNVGSERLGWGRT